MLHQLAGWLWDVDALLPPIASIFFHLGKVFLALAGTVGAFGGLTYACRTVSLPARKAKRLAARVTRVKRGRPVPRLDRP